MATRCPQVRHCHEYVDHQKDEPDSAWPLYQLPDQVASAVKQELKGKPWEQIDVAVQKAVREVLLLFFLQQVVNRKVGEESRYFMASARILLNELYAQRREQAILKLAPPGLLRESVLEVELLPRAQDWKDQAQVFLTELYTLRGAINSVNRCYFDGRQTMFPNMAKCFDRVVACVERLVGGFNGDIDSGPDGRRWQRGRKGSESGLSSLTIALESLAISTASAVTNQVAYLVDMAKAEALDTMGETKKAKGL